MSNEPQEGKAGIGRTFGIVAALTVASKVAGLVRDIVVASCYGTGIVADAYNYAYLLTGNVLVLFGGLGGPFHSTTVTVLSGRKKEASAGALLAQIFAVTFLVLALVSTAAAIIAPLVVPYMAAAYTPAQSAAALLGEDAAKRLFEKQVLEQFRLMLPLLVIAGLVGVAYGISNVFNKVVWPSLSPAIASVAIIVAVLCFSNPDTRLFTGVPLALGTTIGAFGQLLAQLPAVLRSPLKWSLPLKLESGMKDYFQMLWPAVFSTSVGQLTVYVDSFFTLAYLEEGAWTAIINSNRLVQLPLGVLLTAMLVPILPRFTEQVVDGRVDDLKDEFRRSVRFLWFLSLPLSAVLLALPEPIVRLLFQRGHFDAHSTELVTTALVFLVPSIFFYVARDLITRVFYAFRDSKTPYHVALVAIFVKAGLDWLLLTRTDLGVGGVSTATTLITILNLTLLFVLLQKRIGNLGFSRLARPLSIMLIAAASSWLSCITFYGRAISLFGESLAGLALAVASASILALVVFGIVCLIFRLEEPLMLLRRLRQSR